ncbi:MAG TPA: TetR/AcrR family transcriptional regulator [Desulfobulbaceae bacterium]|nr:TetR/AcrR family transcriptional regulator [Desulfobulbaceae bacterium]
MKSSDKHTSDKHSKIIKASTKVFAKKGFFNARISDIAKEAKVADGTIYLYFNNKLDILISVFEQEIGRLIVQVTALLEKEDDPRKMLEIFISKHLTEMKKNRNLAEVIQIELRQTNKLIRDYRNDKFSEYLNILSSIIRKGQQENIFRQDIMPGIAKRIIFGGLDEIARIWSLKLDTKYTVNEATKQMSDLYQFGILAPDD